MKTQVVRVSGLLALSLGLSACGSNGQTYSVLSTGQSFKQATTGNSRLDILWVVDNSGSMDPLQTNLNTNFNSFMNNFTSKGYDFHMSVTSTDSYKANANFTGNAARSVFSDGVRNHSGIFNILSTTLNPVSVFVNNATLGSSGSGDERAFSSMREALNNPTNSGFLRTTSRLAVIILSDEDDFSDPTRPELSWYSSTGVPDHSYTNPGLESVASYESYLDGLTNSTAANRRYSVNAITVLDSACQQAHVAQSPTTIIGQRYIQMVGDTKGALGSVCDASFATSLASISQKIIELQSQFYITGDPVPSSISITVDGEVIPQDPVNGWTYDQMSKSVTFHGSGVPAPGADIGVNYDPQSVQF